MSAALFRTSLALVGLLALMGATTPDLTPACDGGDLEACATLGKALARGDQMARDPVAASRLFRQACDGGIMRSCFNLALLLIKGDGLPRDPAAARDLYARACDGGHAISCVNLGRLQEIGEGGPADASVASGRYRQACDGGAFIGCQYLARLYQGGIGVAADPKVAAELLRRACEGGVGEACGGLPPDSPHGTQPAGEDEAIFRSGFELGSAGKTDDALAKFSELVKKYPDSRRAPAAWVRIGEHWFDNGDWSKARESYEYATAGPRGDADGFASYKMAWCDYNTGDTSKAIENMAAVVASPRTSTYVHEGALKALVHFYADAGTIESASDYFKKTGRPDLYRDLLLRVAVISFDQGAYLLSADWYRALITEDPDGADSPEFQKEIILALLKAGEVEQTLAEVDVLLQSYGPTSPWAGKNAPTKDNAQDKIEGTLRTVATRLHQDGKRLRTGEAAQRHYLASERVYKLYFTKFPGSKYNTDMRYAHAELLYTLKKYDLAYGEYMKVVALDPKGEHAEFCAESAIFAAGEVIKGLPKTHSIRKGDSNPAPLTEWEQKELAALDQLVRLYPGNPKSVNVSYKAAYGLYARNWFPDAADRFLVAIAMNPTSEEAENAANLIVDALTLTKNWPKLRDITKALLDQPGLGTTAFKEELRKIYTEASSRAG